MGCPHCLSMGAPDYAVAWADCQGLHPPSATPGPGSRERLSHPSQRHISPDLMLGVILPEVVDAVVPVVSGKNVDLVREGPGLVGLKWLVEVPFWSNNQR